MSNACLHRPNPLTFSLKAAALASAFTLPDQAAALVIIRDEQTITANSPRDTYHIERTGVLTGNGARTRNIVMDAGSRMIFNDGLIDGAANGVVVGGANAVINRSTVRGGTGAALRLEYIQGNPETAYAEANQSILEGGTSGVAMCSRCTLVLNDSQVSGAAQNGITMFTSTVRATQGSITGQLAGIGILYDYVNPGVTSLQLSGTQVTGIEGPAIDLSPNVQADIFIANGTTLTGGDGNLIKLTDATANVTVDNSQLTGSVDATEGSTLNLTLQNGAALTGQLNNVDRLTLASQGQWNMVADGTVGELVMGGGAVSFGEPDAYYQLNVQSLSGNGNFIMDANFVTGEHDFLNVEGQATGNHTLLIGSSGADPVTESQMHVVHTGGGDAQFSLLNGPVDLGAFSYDIRQDGNDWYLDTTSKVVSPGTRSVLALFNTAPTVWYGELSTLRSRMGELRLDGGKAGGWIRSYGNKYNVSAASGVGYKQTQQGLSFGADAPLPAGDGQWLVGLLGGYSKSDLDLDRGTSGEVDSFYLGAYTTWLDADSGYYVDGVVKFNRFQNESSVRLSDGSRTKGDYKNNGLGASVEVGRHIKLNDGYFIEPYTQLSGVVIQGKDYDLDNGLKAEGDRTHSLLGKVGATVGRNFEMGNGRFIQPYVRAAYAHEFAKNNEVQVNNNVFNNDLSGSRGELGAGLAVQLADRLQAHVDLDYSNGDNIEQPWGANFGLRYSW